MKNIILIAIIVASFTLGSCGTITPSDRPGMPQDTTIAAMRYKAKESPEKFEDLAAYLRVRVRTVIVSPDGSHITVRSTEMGTPIVIVDGIEMSFEQANSMVFPDDIISVTIDSRGTLFGFRGKNGVVTITTKQGRSE